MDRRNFIKFTLLSIGSLFMPMGLWATVFESKLSQFMKLSKQLTGFDDLDIVLGEQYLEVLGQSFGDSVETLLSESLKYITTADLELLFNNENQALLQSIIQLWYTGSINNETVSADAYSQSLLWPTIHANAPGQCGREFGFWQTNGEQDGV